MADGLKKRILWLHTQPEHYHNCMIDDLAQNSDFEYIAAFSHHDAGPSKEAPTPQKAQTVFLSERPGVTWPPKAMDKLHLDWRKDLYPLHFDAAVVAGYGWRTHREFLRDCHRRGIPVAMFSDSNMRSQLGTSLKARASRLLKKRFLQGIIKSTDVLLAANRLGVEYWTYYGAAPEKIVICPYYADYHRVQAATQTDRAQVLARIGLKPQDRVIFSAARLVDVKGLDLMIKAFLNANLAEKGFRYVIAGVGPLESQLKQLAGNALGKSILFVGFQQPSDNLALMHHSDLFVLPSRYEPHGIVVQESLAASTPVIASDVVGAAYDLVEPEKNGQIFRSDDARDLQQKVEWMLADPQRLAAMRLAARKKFETWFAEFSPITVVDRVMHELLARGGGGGRK